MAKMTLVTAGFLLSGVLVLAASCEAPPDCKTSPGSPGCPSPKAVKSIVPPKPGTTSQAAEPKPGPEPQTASAKTGPKAVPLKTAKRAARKPLQRKHLIRRSARSSGQSARPYRYDGQPELRASWPPYPGARPSGGRVQEAGRGPTPLFSDGCGEICQYRAWFQQYNAWYQAYGRRYPAYPDAPRMAGGQSGSQSERDRLDPWHGYNADDGPQNGY